MCPRACDQPGMMKKPVSQFAAVTGITVFLLNLPLISFVIAVNLRFHSGYGWGMLPALCTLCTRQEAAWKCNQKKTTSSSLQRWCCMTQKISGQGIVTKCLLILIWVEPDFRALLPLCQGNTSSLKQHWVLLWTQSTVNRQTQVIVWNTYNSSAHECRCYMFLCTCSLGIQAQPCHQKDPGHKA